MLKIGVIRWKGQCSRHSRYDPGIDGLGGIKGGCKRCELLFDIHTHHQRLIASMREFGTRTEAALKQESEPDRQLSLLDV